MALDVRYGEIRSNVIAKLVSDKEDMVDLLGMLEDTVNSLPTYMEGDTLIAYIDEFNTIVKEVYSKLNDNLGAYADQLESVCKEFESLDADMNTQLS